MRKGVGIIMTSRDFAEAFCAISKIMAENREYLIQLDQQNGDGDLGISMDNGFRSCANTLMKDTVADLGSMMLKAAITFNEAAPSSLGTILSFGMMGMAKSLKGKMDIAVSELADAMQEGIKTIMEKAHSKTGEKTILDALQPGVDALRLNEENVFAAAFSAASKGSEETRWMRSVHGRASYYGEKSIGMLDGGSVVGKLIFQGILEAANCAESNAK